MSQRETSTTGAAAEQTLTIAGVFVLVVVAAITFLFLWSPMTGLLSVVALFLGFQLLLWIVPPVLTYRFERTSADPIGDTFDMSSPDLPEPVTTAMRSNVPVLENLGFFVAGHYRRPVANSFYSEVFTTLMLNRKTRQVARILTYVQRRKSRETVRQIVGFATEFTDGTTLGTSNNRNPVISRAGLREGSMALPDISDPRHLYEIHQAALAAYCGDGIRRDLSQIDPDLYQAEVYVREMTKLVELGYYALDDEQREYRPTLKGVVFLNARLRWPIRTILRALRERKTARMLRELGLDGRDRMLPSDGVIDHQAV